MEPDMNAEVQPHACPHCGRKVNSQGRPPKEGELAVAMCTGCGKFAVVESGNRIRALGDSPADRALAARPEVRAVHLAWRTWRGKEKVEGALADEIVQVLDELGVMRRRPGMPQEQLMDIREHAIARMRVVIGDTLALLPTENDAMEVMLGVALFLLNDMAVMYATVRKGYAARDAVGFMLDALRMSALGEEELAEIEERVRKCRFELAVKRAAERAAAKGGES